MVNLERKKRAKKILYSKVTIVIAFIILVILLNATWNAYQKAKFTRENEEAANRELMELQERAEFLRGKTEALSTPEGIEREIRENLPVAKEGERVIILVEDKDDLNEEGSAGHTEESWWKEVFPWF